MKSLITIIYGKEWGKYAFVLFWENIALKDYKTKRAG